MMQGPLRDAPNTRAVIGTAVAFVCGALLHAPWKAGDLGPLWLPTVLLGVLFIVIFYLTGLSAQRKAINDARKYESKGFQVTRRIIAISAVFAIIVWPKIVAVFWPDIPVNIGYTEWNPGFLFFTEGKEAIKWQALTGLVITPLDTHLLSAIVGLYFGASMVKNAR